MHRVISDTAELKTLCQALSGETFITVDTEFIRERTYYPQLCLIQLAGEKIEAAIDPLAEGMDLSAFFELMANEKLLKIFHAAKQDVEIFLHLNGAIPTPLYDTQVAAMVCGFGESVGYESLVNKLLGEELDKSSRYTDWAARPLTQRQIDYAISDVTYLRDIYDMLKERVHEQGRDAWIAEDMAEMNDRSYYEVDPDALWRKIKYKNRRPEHLNRVRAVSQWREDTAKEKNLPRGRIFNDDTLLRIASLAPKILEEMEAIRGITKHLSPRRRQWLLDALLEADALPKEQWPKDEKRKSILKPEQQAALEVLKILLKMRCSQDDVASRLVANKDELTAFVADKQERSSIHFMHGWRYEVFGQYAEAFIDGKLALRYSDTGICFEEG